ncbi:MAG: hypothetical protein U0527_00845 [Candidatus Eisenbacteria bacterium]
MLALDSQPTIPTARSRRAPSAAQVVGAIARREIGLAARRQLPRALFFASLVPPVVLILFLLVRLFAEQTTGTKLPWDPVLRFLLIQSGPVTLLALSLGTPLVSRDRAEDVLFLYAVRPVLPWHYALGKLLAVALPSGLLMLTPGAMIAMLRLTVTGDLAFGQASALVAKLTLVAILVACAFSGITVGASAITKKARWSLLIAVMIFVVPDALAKMSSERHAWPIGPASAIEVLIKALFHDDYTARAVVAVFALLGYGILGFLLTTERVRGEMIP